MNGGKETGASLGRNKTAQFSLTECLSNYLTQWKRSQSIIAKYLGNKMYSSVGTWHAACAPAKASLALTWQELQMGQQMAEQEARWALGSRRRTSWAAGNNPCTHGEGVLSPRTQERSVSMGCCWGPPLSSTAATEATYRSCLRATIDLSTVQCKFT